MNSNSENTHNCPSIFLPKKKASVIKWLVIISPNRVMSPRVLCMHKSKSSVSHKIFYELFQFFVMFIKLFRHRVISWFKSCLFCLNKNSAKNFFIFAQKILNYGSKILAIFSGLRIVSLIRSSFWLSYCFFHTLHQVLRLLLL